MDLCIDARMAYCSGIGMYIRHLLKRFHEASIPMRLLVDKKLDLDVEQIHFPASVYSFKEQLLFSSMIPKCDLFWSPHYNVPIAKTRAKHRVCTIHDVCHLIYGSRLQKLYAKFLMKRALKLSDQVITVSEFSKGEIERFFGPQNVQTILLGVDGQVFRKRIVSEKLRKKYDLPKRFAFFVGNHKTHKNLKLLEEAFEKIEGLDLVIMGKGTKKGEVAAEDLPILYSMAKMFIFPSLYEGFGLPPLEAMSAGCPTVVAKAASIPEVCGDASLYFDPTSLSEIRERVNALINEPKMEKELIEKGYKRAREFDWDLCAQKHLDLFAKVVG